MYVYMRVRVCVCVCVSVCRRDWPVDVNYIEAKAYCNWLCARSMEQGLKYRLPSECEWLRMRDFSVGGESEQVDQPWWDRAPGNVNLEHFASACPVDMFAFKHGLFDVIGNVWQHTETPIAPFKGFAFHPLYDDFSIPTFDAQHNLIKGGSFISTGHEATRLARYAFRRHFYQHAGFRYVRERDQGLRDGPNSQSQLRTPPLPLEKDPAVCVILDAQFGQSHAQFNLPPFAQAITQLAMAAVKQDLQRSQIQKQPHEQQQQQLAQPVFERALDIGCGAGRSCFELVRHGFRHVVGLDKTARIIRVAWQLNTQHSLQYMLTEDGVLDSIHEIDLDTLGLAPNANYNLTAATATATCTSAPHREGVSEEVGECGVQFFQADACNLEWTKYAGFDLVLCGGVLEEMSNPIRFLQDVHRTLRLGGLLVLASAYNWDRTRTPIEHWPGGVKEQGKGESLPSLHGVERILHSHFTRTALPMDWTAITRINKRTFTHTCMQVTVWKRCS